MRKRPGGSPSGGGSPSTSGTSSAASIRSSSEHSASRAFFSTSHRRSRSTLSADFNKPEELKEALTHYLKDIDNVDILVNNSGGPPAAPAIEAGVTDYRIAFNRHVVCNQVLIQALVPLMKQGGYGRIINIISTSVKEPIPGLGVSNTIRGAVANWAKTLSREVGPFGITVNNILPGSTNTQRIYDLIENRAKQQNKTPKEIEEGMKADIPLRRFADPEETAYAVAFLASPSAAYISGVNLAIDGGRLGCG
jgi:3-oxoacyl-[acyl-carrier protein] reductase